MAKNTGVLGIAAMLLIFTARERDPGVPWSLNMPGQSFRPLDPGVLLNDLHRMAEMINRMDRLGQMALHPPDLPKLPAGDMFGSGKGVPDLSGLMENLGPLMAAFGSGSQRSAEGDDRNAEDWHDGRR